MFAEYVILIIIFNNAVLLYSQQAPIPRQYSPDALHDISEESFQVNTMMSTTSYLNLNNLV